MKRKLNSEKIFRSFAFVVLLILAIVCILPIILIIVASFTDETTLLANGYRFFPQKYGLEAYVYLLKQSVMMLRAYKISIRYSDRNTGKPCAVHNICLSVVSERFQIQKYFLISGIFYNAVFRRNCSVLHDVDKILPYQGYDMGADHPELSDECV